MFIIYPVSLSLLFHKENLKLLNIPVKSLISVIALVLIIQGLLFKFTFVFGDNANRYVKITNEENRVLAGMATSEEKKNYITELTAYLKKEELTEKDAIIFGHIPMASYAFSLDNALTHIWPSLDSYPYEDLERELNELTDCPIMVYYSAYGDLLTKDISDMYSKKEILLAQYLRDNGYYEAFRNPFFTVCECK